MFLHVVMLKFKPGTGAAEHAAIEAFSARVRSECAGVLRYEYHPNVAARAQGFERAIYSIFESSAAHDAYQISPTHVAMKVFVGQITVDILVCDSEIGAGRV